MIRQKLFIAAVAVLLVSACSEQPQVSGIFAQQKDAGTATVEQSKNETTKYLAYTHTISLELDEDKIGATHQKLSDACLQDTKYNCVILNSSASLGNTDQWSRSSGLLTLRLLPEGVAHFESLLATQGKLVSRSTKAEDLADSILDTQKRIDMLESYRDKLIVLEAKPDNTIDALVKITSELAAVQNKLEYAQGQKAKMMQRVKSDILTIQLHSPYGAQSFWEPITYSLSEFGENFSDGIATVITFAAYVIPWSVFLFILFLALRLFWRMVRRDKNIT